MGKLLVFAADHKFLLYLPVVPFIFCIYSREIQLNKHTWHTERGHRHLKNLDSSPPSALSSWKVFFFSNKNRSLWMEPCLETKKKLGALVSSKSSCAGKFSKITNIAAAHASTTYLRKQETVQC